jgi:Cu-processing system permease protein
MRHALKLARYTLADLLRSRWLVGYAGFFAAVAWAFFYFGEEPSQAIVSLLSLVLLVIPLVSAIFGMTQFYGTREFVELLLTQPIGRRSVFFGQYVGIAAGLSLAFVAGVAGPFLWYGWGHAHDLGAVTALLLAGVLLTCIFTALAVLVATRTENRLRALGTVVLLWLGFTVLYDGLLLFAIMLFDAWPLERPLVVLTLLNPVDLARILILLRLDVAALLGYTGAVFAGFFGSWWGTALAGGALLAWAVVPTTLAARAYRRRDF